MMKTAHSTPLNFIHLRQALVQFDISQFECQHSINSTNTHLKSPCFQDNTLCLVETQTAGHGRNQKVWQSPAYQNIYLSLKIAIHDSSKLHRLPITVGLELCRWLNTLSINAKLKWPNDIFVNDQKLAGILVEVVTHEQQHFAVIGIGMNVNMRSNETIGKPWTSLSNLSNKNWDRNALIPPMVEAVFSAVKQHRHVALSKQFPGFDYLYGKTITIKKEKDLIEGVMSGIDGEGRLILSTGTGMRTLNSGSIITFKE